MSNPWLRRAPLCALLLLAPIAPLAAQDGARAAGLADSLVPGRMVRVTLPSPGRFTRAPRREGELRRLDAGGLVLAVGGRDTTIAREDLRRVEVRVRTGTRGRNAAAGAVGGAAFGAVFGLMLSEVLDECEPGEIEICVVDKGGARRAAMTTSVLTLGGIGALGGALVRTHRWRAVPDLRAARVGLALAPSRVGVVLHF